MTQVTAKLLSHDAWMRFHRNRWTGVFDPTAFAKDAQNYDDVVTFDTEAEGTDAAEEAFDLSNNPSRDIERYNVWGPRRSLSVGDLVEVWVGTQCQTYLCDSIGWKEIA